MEPAEDDIYILTAEGDTYAKVAARAWPSLVVQPFESTTRQLGFSPAELWWLVFDLLDGADPLVPLEGGVRVRLPSGARVLREVLS
jgi:hypothetical protein